MMDTERSAVPYAKIVAFSILLLVPSIDSVLKYVGPVGVVTYLLIGSIFLILGYRFLLPAFLNTFSDRAASIIAVVILIVLIPITAIGYSIANSGRLGGGSDIDDALIIGASQLLSGNYPYYLQTYLGGWLTPLPGAILLAAPFVALGILPFQNIFWLAIFFLIARRQHGSATYALAMLSTVLLISPSFYQALLTGSDHIANTLYVLIGMWLVIRTLSNEGSSAWLRVLAAMFLGLGLSSRANFLLATPLLYSLLAQQVGWRTAAKYCSVTGATFLLVTMPFWAYDPAGFSPLFVQTSKVATYENVLPYAKYLVPFSAIALAVTLSLRDMRSQVSRFYIGTAIVQLYIILVTSVLYAMSTGQFTLFLSTIGYGLFSLFFAVFGGWIAMRELTPPMFKP